MKMKCSHLKKTLIGTLIVVTTMAMAAPPKGWAMLAPAQSSNGAVALNEARAADLKTIQTALESKIVRQRLAELKLSPQEIDTRLSRLSDDQVHQTALQIGSLNPGGDGGSLLVSVLIIAILVVLFMYLVRRV